VILICSVIRTHQHRRDLSRGTHGLIKLALALKDRPARLLQGMDDTDVDERKMKHDGPKTTTTKGNDTRTVHTLNHPRGRPTDTGQNLNPHNCTGIIVILDTASPYGMTACIVILNLYVFSFEHHCLSTCSGLYHYMLLLPNKATSPLPDGRRSTKRGPCVSCHICTLTHTARSAGQDTTTGTNHLQSAAGMDNPPLATTTSTHSAGNPPRHVVPLPHC
jgi:hypothetical protein